MNFLPSADYRYALRKGDKGSDVGVLQLNLPSLVVDGVFGKDTDAAVKEWQREYNLTVDGIAGLDTQRSIIVQLQRPSSHGNSLPAGLLKSIASNESGFALAAAGRHLGDAGWDVGAFCRSSGGTYPTQAFLRSAFDVRESAAWTAEHVTSVRDDLPEKPVASRYLDEMADGNIAEFRWMLAILAHNWPVAARNIAAQGEATSDDDAPADWIIQATNGRLQTPREWCLGYVARATVYVKW